MDFALILFVLTLITGAVWLLDVLVMRKRRRPGAGSPGATPENPAAEIRDPWWVEYGASFFPVILVVFLLRSFVAEPFKIPSGSMIPTLLAGDFILVNKFIYGIRLPVFSKAKLIEIHSPERGDVMVFRWPGDPSIDYIKRVIGLPGDKVAWLDKRLYINDKEVPVDQLPDYLYPPNELYYVEQFSEKLVAAEHRIILNKNAPAFVSPIQVADFPGRENCHYNSSGVTCTVPAGNYFVMGDNRDESSDSRFWGFVPDRNIVGKAFLIWFNFSDLKRIGGFH